LRQTERQADGLLPNQKIVMCL